MRGLIPSVILIFGLGSRLFLGEGAWDIRQMVDRVTIVHMARDSAGGCCGKDGLSIARKLRRELARRQLIQRRSLSIRRHDLLSQRERRVCQGCGKRKTVEFLRERLLEQRDRGVSMPCEADPGLARGLQQR
jgi:hypothetical protein